MNIPYNPRRNCLADWQRAILDAGGELLSPFASPADVADWGRQHKITGDVWAAYYLALRAQEPARRHSDRTGIR